MKPFVRRLSESNLRAAGIFAVTLLALLLAPAVAFADVDEYVIGVDGMAFSLCAYGIEKKLEDIDGIEESNFRPI